jgi:hypothetical protein
MDGADETELFCENKCDTPMGNHSDLMESFRRAHNNSGINGENVDTAVNKLDDMCKCVGIYNF